MPKSNRRCYGKYWRRSSLLRNVLLYLNYQPDNKNIRKYFQNMKCFPWSKLISVLIYLSYWRYNTPSLQLLCLHHHLCQISPWPTQTPFQRNRHHVLHRLPYFFLPHSTTCHNYWIHQTICQVKPIKYQVKSS